MKIENKYNYLRRFIKNNSNACICSECLKIVDALEGSFSLCCSDGIIVRASELFNAYNGKVPKMNENTDLKTIEQHNIKAKNKSVPYGLIYSLWLSDKKVDEAKMILKSEGYKVSTIKICIAFRKFDITKRKNGNGYTNIKDIAYSW